MTSEDDARHDDANVPPPSTGAPGSGAHPGAAGGEEDVRRLLGRFGADPEPVPPDVAARLADVLADLTADRTDEPPSAAGAAAAPVVPVRPPRRWPGVLAAAALLSVVALGVGTVLSDDGSEGDAAGGAALEVPGEAESDSGGTGTPGPTRPEDSPGRSETEGLPWVSAESLPGKLEEIAAQPFIAVLPKTPGRCEAPVTPRGDRLVWVRFEGDLAALVIHRASDGRLVGTVFPCKDPDTPTETASAVPK